MKTFIQKLGKSLMGPLSIIVAAGLLLGLASTLQNPNVFGNVLQDVAFVNNFVSLVNALAGCLVWSSSDSVLYVCGTGYVKGRP